MMASDDVKTEKDKDKASNNRFEKIVSVVALLFALVSLLMAWQANRFSLKANEIAESAMKPDVAFIAIEPRSSFFDDRDASSPTFQGMHAGCDIAIRFSNYGGARDSILGYELTAAFQNSHMSMAGSTAEARSYEFLTPQIYRFGSIFHTEDAAIDREIYESHISSEYHLSFPIHVDGSTSFEILDRVTFIVDDELWLQDLDYLNPHSVRFSDNAEDLFEFVQVSYTFQLASDKSLHTPRVPCLLVAK